jgi:hypothetical protein
MLLGGDAYLVPSSQPVVLEEHLCEGLDFAGNRAFPERLADEA